jgi:hypothetical protein
MQQHSETRKGSPKNKQKQSQEKKKDKMIGSGHEKTGKVKGEGARKKRTETEKGLVGRNKRKVEQEWRPRET